MEINRSLKIIVLLLSISLLPALPIANAQSTFNPTNLTDLFPFGEKSAPKNYGGYGRSETLFKDDFVGDIAVAPHELTPKLDPKGSTGSGTVIPSATNKGEAVNITEIFPNANPLDDFKDLGNNTGISQAMMDSKGKLFTYVSTARYADPAYAESAMDADKLSLHLGSNVTQSGDLLMKELESSDAEGKMGLWGYRHCRNKVLKARSTGGGAGTGNDMPAMLACLNGLNLVNTGTASVDDNTKKCGFPSSLPSEARCTGVTAIGGGSVIASLKLSYLLYPNATTAGASEQTNLRDEFEQAFGNQCYVCQSGGTTSFGEQVAPSVVHRWTKDIAAPTPILTRFDKVQEIVYDNFRKVLLAKCKEENKAVAPADAEILPGDIFHQTGTSGGAAMASWEKGTFWRSPVATQAGGGGLAGGISPMQALDYLSFNGFQLIPAVVDALHQLVLEKESITEATTAGGANAQCDNRLGDAKWAYAQVKTALLKQGAAVPVPREIKALFRFSQRIALGKVYDACGQVLAKVNQVNLTEDMARDAAESIAKVCGGDVNDPTAFGKNQLNNYEELQSFIVTVFQKISVDSGKSGSALARAFTKASSDQPT